jgi:hypothetical protein
MKFFALLALLFSTQASAYVPPVSFIISEAMKSHESIKTIVMEGKITDLRNQMVLNEVLRIDFTSGHLSASYSSDKTPEGSYDSTMSGIHRLGKFWITLGMDPSSVRFRQALSELNAMPTEKTEAKLWRVGSTVTWMWGEAPVVQFVKDDFLPADYLSGGAGPSGQEILINEYTSSASSTRVPKTVFIKFQGKEVYRFDVKSVKINQALKLQASGNTLKSSMAKDWVTLVR